jgi:ABC-type Zn uptake system ZnuABC Zn-binding protein ZnuA
MAASEELLGLLHDAVAQDLLTKIKDGTATPAEISTAVKFLKDNGIEAVAAENSKLKNLADSLPEFDEEEPLHARH